jgi:hypothetical protein
MQVDNLLIVKQPLEAFLDKRINIEVVNMFNIRLKHGHFNKKFQHLHKNLHILLQSHNVAPKALVGLKIVAYKVKDG